MSRRRRIFGLGFERLFDSASGVRAALVLDYAGIEGGRFWDGTSRTLSFDDLHTFARASTATQRDIAGLITTSASGDHRLDHNKDGNRTGLLIEEARTNSVFQSEDFGTTWAETGTSVVSTNTTVAPDGQTTADTLTDNNGSGFELIASNAITASDSQTWTLSVYVLKDAIAKTTRWSLFRVEFGAGTPTTFDVMFDTSTGEVVGHRVSGTGTLGAVNAVDAGDYWRITITVTNNATGNTSILTKIYPAAGASATISNANISNTATGSIIVWGAQLELGKFPTSYIPTTTVPVTRAAETAPIAVSGYAYSATLGSVSANVTPNHTPTAEMILVSFNDTTANEVIQIVADSSANVDFSVVDGSTQQLGADGLDSLVNAVGGTELKVAASWAINDFAISVDGATIAVDIGGTLPTLTTIDPCDNGHTTSIRAWNVTLSDADLVAEGA